MPLAHDFDATVVAGVAFRAYEPVMVSDDHDLVTRLKLNPWFTSGAIDPQRHAKWARQRGVAAKLDALLASPLYEVKMADNGSSPTKKDGGEFFALIDELEASDRRLNEAAKPLLAKAKETERLAQEAIGTRMDRLDVAQDYIKRVAGVTEQLNRDNQGPKVDPTTESVKPSPSADASKA